MSNSPQADNVDSGPRPGLPTAMIHKKILDAARDDPSASHTEISKTVSGASTRLVERVLENYGDPAERLVDETPNRGSDGGPTESVGRSNDVGTAQSETTSKDAEPTTDGTTGDRSELSDTADLTEAQLETLTAVAEHPGATQRELAEILDVSCATVNRRVSAVEGLSWTDRRSFVESFFADRDRPDSENAPGEADSTDGDEAGRPSQSGRALDDPALVQKILHACLESERISDDEELDIISAFVTDC